jgi:hypothetical protein
MNRFNKFVKEFLVEHNGDDTIVDLWMSKANQKQVKLFVNDKKHDKQSRDPNMPKKPKSAYLLFCDEFRQEVREALPQDAKVTEVTVELGQRWKDLKSNDEDSYRAFQERAEEAKAEYKTSMESYYVENPSVKRTGAHSLKKKSKRPQTPYIIFCNTNRSRVRDELQCRGDDSKVTEVTKELGKLWKALREEGGEEYDEYVRQSQEARERFQEVAESEEVDEDAEEEPVVVVAKPKRSTVKPASKAVAEVTPTTTTPAVKTPPRAKSTPRAKQAAPQAKSSKATKPAAKQVEAVVSVTAPVTKHVAEAPVAAKQTKARKTKQV